MKNYVIDVHSPEGFLYSTPFTVDNNKPIDFETSGDIGAGFHIFSAKQKGQLITFEKLNPGETAIGRELT